MLVALYPCFAFRHFKRFSNRMWLKWTHQTYTWKINKSISGYVINKCNDIRTAASFTLGTALQFKYIPKLFLCCSACFVVVVSPVVCGSMWLCHSYGSGPLFNKRAVGRPATRSRQVSKPRFRGLFLRDGLNLKPAWISNHASSNKVWDVTTYPFPNFNGYRCFCESVEVFETEGDSTFQPSNSCRML